MTTDEGKKLLEKEIIDKNLIYIISAAQDVNELLPFAEKHGIRKDRVFATGSNQKKKLKRKKLVLIK